MRCRAPDECFEVALLLPAEDWREAVVVDLTTERVDVRFAGGRPPVLRVGETLDVRFEDRGTLDRLVVPARVVRRVEGADPRERDYSLELLSPDAFWRGLSEAARARFDQRDALRVRPPRGRTLFVTLESACPEVRARGRIDDLSVMGLGVVVRGSPEGDLAGVETVAVTFEVPGHREPLRFLGRIRRRLAQPRSVRYGIAFDATGTPHFSVQQAALGRYVAELQRRRLTVPG